MIRQPEHLLSLSSPFPRFSKVALALGGDPHVAAEGDLAGEGHQGKAEKGQGHEKRTRQIGHGQGLCQRLGAQLEKPLFVRPGLNGLFRSDFEAIHGDHFGH